MRDFSTLPRGLGFGGVEVAKEDPTRYGAPVCGSTVEGEA